MKKRVYILVSHVNIHADSEAGYAAAVREIKRDPPFIDRASYGVDGSYSAKTTMMVTVKQLKKPKRKKS